MSFVGNSNNTTGCSVGATEFSEGPILQPQIFRGTSFAPTDFMKG